MSLTKQQIELVLELIELQPDSEKYDSLYKRLQMSLTKQQIELLLELIELQPDSDKYESLYRRLKDCYVKLTV